MPQINRILIIKLSAIGDVVHALPLLEVLKRTCPRARIDWIVEEDASKILEGHPGIDRLMISRRKVWMRGMVKSGSRKSSLLGLVRFLKQIRVHQYDLVIDLQGLLKSGILTGLVKGKRKIGMSGAREGGGLFLNERPVPVDYEQHAVERYLKIAQFLGCGSIAWKGRIPVFEEDRRRIVELLARYNPANRPLIAVNPMAKWQTKLWETKRFAVLADKLKDAFSCEIVFTGSGKDRDIIAEISAMMRRRSINLAGKTTLKGLAHLLTLCKVLVTTDTGPMHIAAAMHCPVVALFGPTAPWRTGPYGNGHQVIRSQIECSPCFKKSCPHTRCMKDILVTRVFQAVHEILLRNEMHRHPKGS